MISFYLFCACVSGLGVNHEIASVGQIVRHNPHEVHLL
jgi:hypothetical protein